MSPARRPIVVLGAPSNLGLRPLRPGHEPGVRRMPDALRAAGIVERLGASDAGDVVPAAYDPSWEPGAGTRNAAAIAKHAVALADGLGTVLAEGSFPVVLGGDCSVLVGSMLALRRLGRFGLAFVDGHLDFRHPGNGDVQAAAGEELALITGRGDPRLTDIEDRAPLVRDRDVVAIGFGIGPIEGGTPDILDTSIGLVGRYDLRRVGAEQAARGALARLPTHSLEGIWVHVDVDVLDGELMPAVDSPGADGLTWDEFERLVGCLVADPLAVGLELTIFDPDLDPDGSLARRLVQAIGTAFDLPD